MRHRLDFNVKELHKVNCKLLYATHGKYEQDWHSVKHSHNYTEIFYVLKGVGYYQVNNKAFPIQEDDLIIVNPNVGHTELSKHGYPLEYIVLGIEGVQFLNKEDRYIYDYSLHNYAEYKNEILFYLKNLVEESNHKQDHYELVCQHLLEILIIHLVRRTKEVLRIESSSHATKECRYIEQYINEHYFEDITLSKLSQLTFLNKYYIVHSFKRYKGITPIQFLIEKRIKEAKNLLSSTNYPISKIGELVGFSSQSYFSQIFKKETNYTPHAYRKLMVKK